MQESEKIILADDPEAATYREGIKGWVSRVGHYFGENESAARYDGSTCIKCKCGEIYPKQSVFYCKPCAEKGENKRYLARPTVPISEVKFFMVDGEETVYDDIDSFFDDCLWNEVHPKDLHVMEAVPVRLSELAAEDVFSGIISGNDEVILEDVIHPDVWNAFIALSDAIQKHREVGLYEPGERRIDPEAWADFTMEVE